MVTIWTRESLQGFKEDDLTREVLVPLFAKMGYHDVRFHGSGILEQGQDMTMWREDTVRARINAAAVVKAAPITGQAATTAVLYQIKQAFATPFRDTATGVPHQVHECFVITPHEVKKEGTFTLANLLQNEPLGRYVTVIDGHLLWSLVQQYLGPRTTLGVIMENYRAFNSRPDYNIDLKLQPHLASMTIQSRDGQPIPVTLPTFAETPEGIASKERFETFQRTGEQTTLELAHVTGGLQTDELRADFGDPSGGLLRLRKTVPEMHGSLRCRNDAGEAVAIPGVVMTGHAGSEQLTLTNEQQRIPLHFRLQLSFPLGTEQATLQMQLRSQGWSIYWYVLGLDFLRVASSGALLSFTEFETGLEQTMGRITVDDTTIPSNEHQSLSRRVLRVQEQPRVPIVVPERQFFTMEDVANLRVVEDVLRHHRLYPTTINVELTPNDQNPIDWQHELTSVIDDLSLEADEYVLPVLDTMVPVGPMAIRPTPARYRIENVDATLTTLAAGTSVRLQLVPTEQEHFTAIFRGRQSQNRPKEKSSRRKKPERKKKPRRR